MTISSRDRVLLGAVALIAALAAVYVLAVRPQQKRVTTLDHSIASAQRTLVSAQRAYVSGRAAQHQLASDAGEYAAARQAVPQTSNVPALLRLLQRTAAAAHVSVESISMSGSGSTANGAASSSISGSATPTGAGGGAQTVPVSLTFGGGYQALHRMVRALGGLVTVSHDRLRADGPLVGISSVALSPSSSAGTHGLSVQLSATIYQHSTAGAAAGTTPEGSPS